LTTSSNKSENWLFTFEQSTASESPGIFQNSLISTHSIELEYQKYLERVILELQDSPVRKYYGPSSQELIQGAWIERKELDYQSNLQWVIVSSTPNLKLELTNSVQAHELKSTLAIASHHLDFWGSDPKWTFGDQLIANHNSGLGWAAILPLAVISLLDSYWIEFPRNSNFAFTLWLLISRTKMQSNISSNLAVVLWHICRATLT